MNKQTIVIVLGILCLSLAFSSSRLFAQAPTLYVFEQAPYATSLMNSLSEDQYGASDVEAVLKMGRAGRTDVHVTFLEDRFYLFFDLTGLKQVYLFDYHGTVEAYQSELSLSGIPESEMTATELVNCVLKYHTRE